MQRINFDIGESRHVRLLIKSANDQAFVVRNATWELLKDGEPETSGECLIDNHIIDAFITPQEKAIYKLKFKYQIADEILIEIIDVWTVNGYG